MYEKSQETRGRPKGRFTASVLDDKEDDIRRMLRMKFAKSEIARILNVPYTNLVYFVRTRKLS